MDTSAQTTRPSTIPMTGTWFSRWGSAYELSEGLDYNEALRIATQWAHTGLEDESVELEVDLFRQGEDWVVDVVAFEGDVRVEQLGTRRARITRTGALVA